MQTMYLPDYCRLRFIAMFKMLQHVTRIFHWKIAESVPGVSVDAIYWVPPATNNLDLGTFWMHKSCFDLVWMGLNCTECIILLKPYYRRMGRTYLFTYKQVSVCTFKQLF